jgi:sulfite reductase beta subunit-like hemoprotein
MFDVAEAIIRVFHRLGDYQHKQRNRLKFLVRSLGWEGFRAEYERELAELQARGGASLPFDPERPALEEPPPLREDGDLPLAHAIAARATATTLRGPGIIPNVEPRLTVKAEDLVRWSQTNVRPQKQHGRSIVIATTLLGDLTSSQMRLLGELAEGFGDGTVRVTSDQNILFRWVRTSDVSAFYRSLAAAGLARPGAGTLADVTSCPGAESCRLAVTQSRGLGKVLAEHLQARPDVVSSLPGLDIKISGCPNGCGQHHIAGIGFQGSLRKVGAQPAPHYFVTIGGGAGEGMTTFGRLAAKVPARRCTEAVERLAQLFRDEHAPGESPIAFFRRVDLGVAKASLADLERLAPEAATPDDFVDLGEETAFQPEVMDGECSV